HAPGSGCLAFRSCICSCYLRCFWSMIGLAHPAASCCEEQMVVTDDNDHERDIVFREEQKRRRRARSLWLAGGVLLQRSLQYARTEVALTTTDARGGSADLLRMRPRVAETAPSATASHSQTIRPSQPPGRRTSSAAASRC